MTIRNVICGLASILLLASLANASDFYEAGVINTVQLLFPDDNWDTTLDTLYKADLDNDGEYDRLLCTVTINGVAYENAGARYKGNSSYNDNNAKNPFNIKLDYLVDQTHEGAGTLKLSNGLKDPSFVRETLSYEIARKYMAASQANYAAVYVYNHSAGEYEYLGLYTNVEAVDKAFLSKHLASDNNAFFKCNPTDTWTPTSSNSPSLEYLGSDPSLYYDSYQVKSDNDTDWTSLIDFTYSLAYNPQNVESLVDLDRALWMLAFDNALANLDSYIGDSKQNYYLYQTNDSRWVTILWDLNESFGAFSMSMDPFRPGPSSSLSDLDPLLRMGDDSWPLADTLLSDSTYRKMYIAHMRTILEENFSNGWYETRAHELQNVIDSHVQDDANKFYTYSDFVYNIDYTCQNVVGIAELMDDRVASLNSDASFTATAPGISNIGISPEAPATNSIACVTANVSNATSVTLAYRYSSTGAFTKVAMADDGGNNDDIAGDGTYGASLPVANTNVEYYIYAENDTAGMFSPERAEHEFYTLDVSPTSVVINEIMAENDTTLQDPAGEGYPDWIELYNPGAAAVDLGGMYLTDNLSDTTCWRIPDGVTIAAGGYLVIWADNDEDQGNTHANFKLDNNGEAVGLFDSDANGNMLIDSITFGPQTADVSFGRTTDGATTWDTLACPSPGTTNAPSDDLPGDANGDNVVDLGDFVILKNNFGATEATRSQGDFNDDGVVDLDDFVILKSNFGAAAE